MFIFSNVSVWKTECIRLRNGCVPNEIFDELVEGCLRLCIQLVNSHPTKAFGSRVINNILSCWVMA